MIRMDNTGRSFRRGERGQVLLIVKKAQLTLTCRIQGSDINDLKIGLGAIGERGIAEVSELRQ